MVMQGQPLPYSFDTCQRDRYELVNIFEDLTLTGLAQSEHLAQASELSEELGEAHKTFMVKCTEWC